MNRVILSAFADEASRDLVEQIRELKRNNLNYMEIRGVDGKNISDISLDEAREIKVLLDSEEIGISSIGSPIGKIYITEDFEGHLKLFKHILDLADILDTRYIRMFSFFIPDGEDPNKYREEVIKRWKGFIEIAKGRGKVLLHENEKGIYGDTPARCLDLIESLECEYVRLVFDPANFIQCDEEVYPYSFELLKEHIEYFHIKDAKRESGLVVPAGYGDGSIDKIVRGVKKRGYSGFFSLEPHLAEFEGFSNLENSEENKLPKGESKEKFMLAVDSFKTILEEEGYEYL